MTKKLDVKAVRGEISHHISPAVGWLRLEPLSEVHMKKYLERIQLAAEAIVKMAEGEPEYEYNLLVTKPEYPDSGVLVDQGWRTDLEYVESLAEMYADPQKEFASMYIYSIVRRPKAEPYEIIKTL